MVELGFIHVNLGNAFLSKGLFEEAKKNCNEGKYLAQARDDNEGVIEAKKCLEQIESLIG